ncbi:unnamed protein product [Owenia fusiformis]|uniref:Uncharacterized protein n=1 Tax=Owenia fusiformis TaxID=6347 RepID=A0A8J1Y5E9_OWEFU|nr:unnamed protein product [Owenia fusiformis]
MSLLQLYIRASPILVAIMGDVCRRVKEIRTDAIAKTDIVAKTVKLVQLLVDATQTHVFTMENVFGNKRTMTTSVTASAVIVGGTVKQMRFSTAQLLASQLRL